MEHVSLVCRHNWTKKRLVKISCMKFCQEFKISWGEYFVEQIQWGYYPGLTFFGHIFMTWPAGNFFLFFRKMKAGNSRWLLSQKIATTHNHLIIFFLSFLISEYRSVNIGEVISLKDWGIRSKMRGFLVVLAVVAVTTAETSLKGINAFWYIPFTFKERSMK